MNSSRRNVILRSLCALSMGANGVMLCLIGDPEGNAPALADARKHDRVANPPSQTSERPGGPNPEWMIEPPKPLVPEAPESIDVPYALIQSQRARPFDRISPDGLQLAEILQRSLGITENEKARLDQAAKTLTAKLRRSDRGRARLITDADGSAYFRIEPDVAGTASIVNAMWTSIIEILGSERGRYLQDILAGDRFLKVDSEPIEVAMEYTDDIISYVESGRPPQGIHGSPLEDTRYGHLFEATAWNEYRLATAARIAEENARAERAESEASQQPASILSNPVGHMLFHDRSSWEAISK